MTCSASTRSACSRAWVARSIATPASPHISPSWSVRHPVARGTRFACSQAYGRTSRERHDVDGERKVNAACLKRVRVLGYSQVVSARVGDGQILGQLRRVRRWCREDVHLHGRTARRRGVDAGEVRAEHHPARSDPFRSPARWWGSQRRGDGGGRLLVARGEEHRGRGQRPG